MSLFSVAFAVLQTVSKAIQARATGIREDAQDVGLGTAIVLAIVALPTTRVPA